MGIVGQGILVSAMFWPIVFDYFFISTIQASSVFSNAVSNVKISLPFQAHFISKNRSQVYQQQDSMYDNDDVLIASTDLRKRPMIYSDSYDDIPATVGGVNTSKVQPAVCDNFDSYDIIVNDRHDYDTVASTPSRCL